MCGSDLSMSNESATTGIISRLMNDKQAAKFLDVGLQTLRNWRFLRKGPDYHKLGRAVRYRERDLLKYLESRKIRVDGRNPPISRGHYEPGM